MNVMYPGIDRMKGWRNAMIDYIASYLPQSQIPNPPTFGMNAVFAPSSYQDVGRGVMNALIPEPEDTMFGLMKPGFKEPWQMTYRELRNVLQPQTKADVERIESSLRSLYPEYTKSKYPDTKNDFAYGIWRMANRKDEIHRIPFTDLSKRHREIIRQAMQEGNEIPQYVLDDYPGLNKD